MHKVLGMLIGALLYCGCGGTNISDPGDITSPRSVIDGFGDEPRILTSTNIVRVGTYYDFSVYDSLRISFTATRLSADRPFDEIIVKIGPSTYLRDSVFTTQKNVSITVSVSRISKPSFCALTFWTLDPLTVLSLSNLRVTGWTKP